MVTEMKFTSDWFSHNIPNWLKYIDTSKPLDVLELGVFEGRSVVWMLENLKVKSLVAVDLWDQDWLERQGHFNTEKNFDYNVKSYSNVRKVKADTYSFLKSNKALFDLIYIDAKHNGKSVLTDAMMSHHALRKGGYIVFDDYSQSLDATRIDRARGAIDAFLYQFSDEYTILFKGYQVIVKKK